MEEDSGRYLPAKLRYVVKPERAKAAREKAAQLMPKLTAIQTIYLLHEIGLFEHIQWDLADNKTKLRNMTDLQWCTLAAALVAVTESDLAVQPDSV